MPFDIIHIDTLSKFPDGICSTHPAKYQIFKNFLGWDLAVNFPPVLVCVEKIKVKKMKNPPRIIWKSSEGNWLIYWADLKIYETGCPKYTEMAEETSNVKKNLWNIALAITASCHQDSYSHWHRTSETNSYAKQLTFPGI